MPIGEELLCFGGACYLHLLGSPRRGLQWICSK